jgi:replicative DNA helicase
MSSQYKIPAVGVVQARRRQNESKNNEQVDMDAESIGGSYSLAQVATRIVAIQKKADALQLSIAKNRYGLVDKKLLYAYDFDHLTFDYIPNLEDIANNEELKDQKENMKDSFKNTF